MLQTKSLCTNLLLNGNSDSSNFVINSEPFNKVGKIDKLDDKLNKEHENTYNVDVAVNIDLKVNDESHDHNIVSSNTESILIIKEERNEMTESDMTVVDMEEEEVNLTYSNNNEVLNENMNTVNSPDDMEIETFSPENMELEPDISFNNIANSSTISGETSFVKMNYKSVSIVKSRTKQKKFISQQKGKHKITIKQKNRAQRNFGSTDSTEMNLEEILSPVEVKVENNETIQTNNDTIDVAADLAVVVSVNKQIETHGHISNHELICPSKTLGCDNKLNKEKSDEVIVIENSSDDDEKIVIVPVKRPKKSKSSSPKKVLKDEVNCRKSPRSKNVILLESQSPIKKVRKSINFEEGVVKNINKLSEAPKKQFIKTENKLTFKKEKEFHFDDVPEAPVFYPTDEEFENPLVYIESIRPIGEKTGICKIIPPKSWKPPFALNFDKFRFNPRVQTINQLEASTRIKLSFIDKLTKFWAIKGEHLKVPMFERKLLDVYMLHKLVQQYGGKDKVTNDKKWSELARHMGYIGKAANTFLKNSYDRILSPYDEYEKNQYVKLNCSNNTYHTIKPENIKKEDFDIKYENMNIDLEEKVKVENSLIQSVNSNSEKHIDSKENIVVKENITENVNVIENDLKLSCIHVGDESLDSKSDLQYESLSESKRKIAMRELQSLQFLGPGPKMAVFNHDFIDETGKTKTRGKKILYDFDPMSKYVCKVCTKDTNEYPNKLITCMTCSDRYHHYCLVPPLKERPNKPWNCPKCEVASTNYKFEEFGFAQADKWYTLTEFGEMGNKFKRDYFNSMPVTSKQVEKEFWRVVSSIDESVTVEYGADLHTREVGSGFPLNADQEFQGYSKEDVQKYVDSKWNLNHLSVDEMSALRYISVDISGMKVPWVYVGMCFAAFCWHNEDHWSYSINYLHWGEPKTWYGVPGSKAESFEESMEEEAPELFINQPDLLHQLVTIMNPNILQKRGLPVFRTDQEAGNFVITFPRAYHAGFNQGFNFAEACNFAPPDWISIGRLSVKHYSQVKRSCVFSHDELIFKIIEAYKIGNVDFITAQATLDDLTQLIECEYRKRQFARKNGLYKFLNKDIANLSDEERQCVFCNTVLYLSATMCACTKSRLACLDHYMHLCDCPISDKRLMWRMKINELKQMHEDLKTSIEKFQNWKSAVQSCKTEDPKPHFSKFVNLLQDCIKFNIPKTSEQDWLANQVRQAANLSRMARMFIKSITKKQESETSIKLSEFFNLKEKLEKISCSITEAVSLNKLTGTIFNFQEKAKEALTSNSINNRRLESLINFGEKLNMDFSELPLLREKLLRGCCTKEFLALNTKRSVEISELVDFINLSHKHNCYHLDEIQNKLNQNNTLIDKIEKCITLKCNMTELEVLLLEADKLNVNSSTKTKAKKIMKDVQRWMSRVNKMLFSSRTVNLEEAEKLRVEGDNFPITLKRVEHLTCHLSRTKEWLEKVNKLFLPPNSNITLVDALWPKHYASEAVAHQDLSYKNFKIGLEQEWSSLQKFRNRNISNKQSIIINTIKCHLCEEKIGHISSSKECSVCKLLFHATCVANTAAADKYICKFCMKTNRPLYNQLSEIIFDSENCLHIPEKIILNHHNRRIVNYKHSVEKLLHNAECKEYYVCKSSAENANGDYSNDVARELILAPALRHLILKGDLIETKLLEYDYIRNVLSALNRNRSLRHPLNKYVETLSSRVILPICTSIDNSFGNASEIKRKNSVPSISNKKKSLEVRRKSSSEINLTSINSILATSNVVLNLVENNSCLYISDTDDEGNANTEYHDDNDNYCAAINCLKPVGMKVDWVMCDGGCSLWYHMVCMNVTKEDVAKEDFICKKCLEKPRGAIAENPIPIQLVQRLSKDNFIPNLDEEEQDPLGFN